MYLSISSVMHLCLQAKAPCIVFIDDIDAIAQKRENASKNMEYRIVLQLCSCLDGNCSVCDNFTTFIYCIVFTW